MSVHEQLHQNHPQFLLFAQLSPVFIQILGLDNFSDNHENVEADKNTKRQKDKRTKKSQKDRKTKRQKDKKTNRQKDKTKTKRQKMTEFNILMSGQFCTLAMF